MHKETKRSLKRDCVFFFATGQGSCAHRFAYDTVLFDHFRRVYATRAITHSVSCSVHSALDSTTDYFFFFFTPLQYLLLISVRLCISNLSTYSYPKSSDYHIRSVIPKLLAKVTTRFTFLPSPFSSFFFAFSRSNPR